MAEYELVIRAERAVTPDGVRPVTVAVRDGRIAAVAGPGEAPDAAETVELPGSQVLLPGLVDTHVHVNEPGRTEWEGFATATRAAAAGGVTTLIDMPLNSLPPTTTATALAVKRAAARPSAHVDVGFWGGAVPGNLDSLAGLHAAGVFGFKAFLADSGVPEFGLLDPAGLDAALAETARLGALLIVHAEDPAVLAAAPDPAGRAYAGFLASRPAAAEDTAIAGLLAAARRHGARVHILHLASASALPLIAAARADGAGVTAETCPHYLSFCAEEVPDGATEFKCCPPVRDAANREGLWAGLAGGLIGAVVSDHSPCPPALKQPGHRGLRGGVGRDLLGPARPARGVDTGTAPRSRPHRRGALDGRGNRRAGRAGRQGRDRPWPRRRPGGVRRHRDVHRRSQRGWSTATR